MMDEVTSSQNELASLSTSGPKYKRKGFVEDLFMEDVKSREATRYETSFLRPPLIQNVKKCIIR